MTKFFVTTIILLVASVTAVAGVNIVGTPIDGADVPGVYRNDNDDVVTDILSLQPDGVYIQTLAQANVLLSRNRGSWRLIRPDEPRPIRSCGDGARIYFSDFMSFSYDEKEVSRREACIYIHKTLFEVFLVLGDDFYSKADLTAATAPP